MLVEAAGSDLFSARKAHPRNENTVLQANLGVFRNDLQDGLEVSVVELKPLFPDLIEVPHRPFDDFNVSCLSFNDQGFGRQGKSDIENVFDKCQVLVEGSEDRLRPMAQGDTLLHHAGWSGLLL